MGRGLGLVCAPETSLSASADCGAYPWSAPISATLVAVAEPGTVGRIWNAPTVEAVGAGSATSYFLNDEGVCPLFCSCLRDWRPSCAAGQLGNQGECARDSEVAVVVIAVASRWPRHSTGTRLR